MVIAAVAVDLPDLDLHTGEGSAGFVEQASVDVQDGALGPAAAARHPRQVVVLVERQLLGIERALALIRGRQELGGPRHRGGQGQRGGGPQRPQKMPSICHHLPCIDSDVLLLDGNPSRRQPGAAPPLALSAGSAPRSVKMTNTRRPLFSGIYPMQYAFFGSDGRLDRAAMRRQVHGCIGGGAHGVAVLGLGTEVNKLSEAERYTLVDWVTEDVAGRVPVAVTVAGASVEAQAALAGHARAAGAAFAHSATPARARHARVPLRAVLRTGDGAGGRAGRDSERPRIHRRRPVRRLPAGAGPQPRQLRAPEG